MPIKSSSEIGNRQSRSFRSSKLGAASTGVLGLVGRAAKGPGETGVTGVAPGHIKPGMKIMIKGSGFGKKECFKDVSFGSTLLKDYKLVSDSTVEVTVPVGLKPGMMKVHVQTAGGTADDTVLLEKK